MRASLARMPLIHDVPEAFSDSECDALIALGAVSDFAVVGRAGTDENCDFFRLDRPVLVATDEAAAPGGVDR